MNEKASLIRAALQSRLLLFIIQYISNLCIPDHDAGVFVHPKPPEETSIDKLIQHLFGGFVRWDGHYFMHIAKYGYTYENTLAFFPLLPYLARVLASFLGILIPFLNLNSLTIIAFIVINTISFVLAAVFLYELSLLCNFRKKSYVIALLFCYNPASVFFSAPYTESLFACLSFKSMLNCVLLHKKYSKRAHLEVKDIIKVLPICLSAVTRSNGVLNIGFLVYTLICLYWKAVKSMNKHNKIIIVSIKYLFVIIMLTLICLIPFIAFQSYCYLMFCTNFSITLPEIVSEYGKKNDFIPPGTFSQYNQSWCSNKIPLAYSYIQSHYWNVGFLKYYEIKQIPNFLLASPMIFIISKGFLNNFNYSLISKPQFPFIVHAIALTFICITNVHIQVTTRMLCSATPVVYWFCGCYLQERNFLGAKTHPEMTILIYFLGYFTLGTVMFCNFLPWT